jgi:hypothetical protein
MVMLSGLISRKRVARFDHQASNMDRNDTIRNMEAKPINSAPPQTVYKTPNPQASVSELYTIFCQQMSNALTLERSWVVHERYGAWDENEPDPKQKFRINVTTLSPTEPRHYLTLDEAHKQCDEQVMLRVRSGFKYLFVHDFFDAPWYKRYEVFPDGTRREIPLN